MTLAELDAFVGARTVLRHHGAVFVHTRDAAEADECAKAGARVQPCGWGGVYLAEVHLVGMLDFVGEPDADEPEVVHDIRPRVLLEHYRERDGFHWPARAEWVA